MGGEDWEMWIDALRAVGVLARRGFHRGLQLHWAGPHLGHLPQRHHRPSEGRSRSTAERLQHSSAPTAGQAFVSVNKALVTQASSAIPVVPLYISLFTK